MQIRTDLALEQRERHTEIPKGVSSEEYIKGKTKITKIVIETKEGEKALLKPKGSYITAEVPSFTDNVTDPQVISVIKNELEKLIPNEGTVLVVGLGNRNITPDALGPKVASKILATRHIEKEILRLAGIDKVRRVAAVSTGVLGQTGIEAYDIIKGITDNIRLSAVIVVDALASRRLQRLGRTVQISDTGIEPGAGVGNARYEISQKTLGIPVIAIGVPTVVDGETLVSDLTDGRCRDISQDGRQIIVTPREIDLLVDRAAALISDVINFTLQKDIDPSVIKEIMD